MEELRKTGSVKKPSITEPGAGRDRVPSIAVDTAPGTLYKHRRKDSQELEIGADGWGGPDPSPPSTPTSVSAPSVFSESPAQSPSPTPRQTSLKQPGVKSSRGPRSPRLAPAVLQELMLKEQTAATQYLGNVDLFCSILYLPVSLYLLLPVLTVSGNFL